MTGREISAPQSVLIIKPSALGDVVTAIPVLRGIRRKFPTAHISWLVRDNCAPLIEHDDDLDEIILFHRKHLGRAWKSPRAAGELFTFLKRLHEKNFDWVIDLQGLIRSGLFCMFSGSPVRAGFSDAREGASIFYTHKINPSQEHTVERNIALAAAIGVDCSPDDMTLKVADPAREFVDGFLRDTGLTGGEYIVCVPPTTWETKKYPPRRWRKVVDAMSREIPVVLVGSPSEEDISLCQQIFDDMPLGVHNLCGKTSVAELVALVASSAGVVCCDSAAKFIAPAVGVDSVTIMGPTRIERTGPFPYGRAIVADVPCRGCLRKRCGHITCMQSIEPEKVISTALEMIA